MISGGVANTYEWYGENLWKCTLKSENDPHMGNLAHDDCCRKIKSWQELTMN